MNAFVDSLLGSGETGAHASASPKVSALAWARVSTDMQQERGQSMPEQLRQIREYAERNGIEIVEEYHEAASAFKKNSHRDEFDKMLARAKSDRTVNAILVHDYSRFSRDSLGARLLVRELLKAGVRVISLNDAEVDTESVAGVYMEAITFAKNEAYSREIAFHTKKGCRANVQTRDPETGWCYKNGGQPLWGYKSERLIRGEEKKGRPLIKSIWVPDDTIVAGKPVHEWARHCLAELAAKGASLDAIRDFCNDHGIPAPRRPHWGTSTWHSLLHPNALLQYAGYGVWNVRGKNQRMNPHSEWVIVENSHVPLITEDEAHAMITVREQRSALHPWQSGALARSKDSRFLLSGGLFQCSRCGANMTGFTSYNGKGRKGLYYVCGSAHYRKRLGCGKAVFVDKDVIEQEVMDGIAERFDGWSDIRSFTQKVNVILQEMQCEDSGDAARAQRALAEVDATIANVRKAIEQGLDDVGWANARLRDLTSQRVVLAAQVVATPDLIQPPKLDIPTVKKYRESFGDLLKQGTNGELRELVRCFVSSMTLAPADAISEETNEPAAHQIEIQFKAMPAQFVIGLGAGRGFEPLTFGL